MVELCYNLNEYNHIKRVAETRQRPATPFSKVYQGDYAMSDITRANEQLQTIPYGYCHCGCGQLAPIATYTIPKRGYFKGRPVRFVHGHNRAKLSVEATHKSCARCLKVQAVGNFSREKRNRDGLKSI